MFLFQKCAISHADRRVTYSVHKTVVLRSETGRIQSLADSCPLWYLYRLLALARVLDFFSISSTIWSRLASKHPTPLHHRIPHKEATHCEFPSCTSSLSCRRLCTCPWATSPAQSASPSSSDRPSSSSPLSSPAHYRVSQQCRQRVVGARGVGTSGGGTGARGFSLINISFCIVAAEILEA